jgi:TRAP-type mannitol/chloroaromatic compound transport system permease small subunit
MGILLKLSHFIDGFSRLIGKSIIWLVLAAALLSAANAVARKAFNVGSNAFLEIQWYLFAAVFMIGAGHTFLQNAHVRIDVLANKLSSRARTWIDIFGILLFLLPMCFFMIQFSWPVVEAAYVSGEMSSNAGGLIRWPVYALVPAGFAVLGLQAVSELIKRIGFLMGKAPDALSLGGHDAAHVPSDATPGDVTHSNAAGESHK